MVALACVFLILGIFRLNDLSLYTDSTRYLIWGNSVAHAKGFVDDTQPVPEYYVVNAPFFSVLLAPVLIVFPLSLIAAKVWTLVWGILALVLFYRWSWNRLGSTPAFIATLLLALNPMTLILTTEVLSEASFLCTVFGIMLLLEQSGKDHHSQWMSRALIPILALTMLLREIGVSLVAAALLSLLVKKKRAIAAAVFFSSAALFIAWTYRNLGMANAPDSSQSPNIAFIFQHFVTSPQTSFFNELIGRIQLNSRGYVLELAGMLFYPFPFNLIVDPSSLFSTVASILIFVKYAVGLLFVPLLGIGIVQDFKRSPIPSFLIMFLGLYLCIILSYPVCDVRFLFPLLPFMIYFSAIAVRTIADKFAFRRSARGALLPAIVALVLLPNIVCIFEVIRTNFAYVRNPYGFATEKPEHVLQAGFFSTPWNAMGSWIEQEVPAASIIASPSKELVPFSPGHKFLELNRAVPLPVFESSLRDYAVEYLLAPTVFDSINEYQTMLDESTRFHFNKLKSVGRLNLYDVQSSLERPEAGPNPTRLTLNLNDTRDLQRLGRLALKNEKYSEALSIFSKIHASFPHLTGAVYQLLLVHTFALDSTPAIANLQELYTSPTATSYIAPARIHIYAMNVLLGLKSLHDSTAKADQYYRVARLYWDLGYPRQAYSTVRQAIHCDSSLFIALLWSWHYAIQLNDVAGASSYLSLLERIDRQNRIVQSYRTMTTLYAGLRRERDHLKRSELRIALAREYDSIDLPAEALDNAQRAIAENPSSRDAWETLASLFETRGQPFAAERTRKKLHDLELAGGSSHSQGKR